jgi:hypothetical protein
MQTSGSVIFRSKDTTLIGAQIIAGTVSNPIDGKLKTAPAYATQENHSYTAKSGFLGPGHSSLEIEETRETVAPTRIIADHFESLGVGTYEMESTLIRALDATITKNLIEKTAYDKIHTRITQKSSEFFAPKIKGDPFVESLRGIRNVVTFGGDTLPTAFNVIGTGAQAPAHATTLANLSTNPNPIAAVASVFLSRFMTGAVYGNTRTVTTVHESRPVQSTKWRWAYCESITAARTWRESGTSPAEEKSAIFRKLLALILSESLFLGNVASCIFDHSSYARNLTGW